MKRAFAFNKQLYIATSVAEEHTVQKTTLPSKPCECWFTMPTKVANTGRKAKRAKIHDKEFIALAYRP